MKNIRTMAPHEIVTDILKDKGLMKEGEQSVFDYFTVPKKQEQDLSADQLKAK
jgi:hypothetical protein